MAKKVKRKPMLEIIKVSHNEELTLRRKEGRIIFGMYNKELKDRNVFSMFEINHRNFSKWCDDSVVPSEIINFVDYMLRMQGM